MQTVQGIPKDVSASQVVWAPQTTTPSCYPIERGMEALMFVGWLSNFSTPRNLRMVYCQDKHCHLHAIEALVRDRNNISYHFLLGFWKFGSVSQLFSNS
jgi:acylaminoacyl-peptidase